MEKINKDIVTQLIKSGVDFVHFADISMLPGEQNKEFPRAILFGIALTPEYIHEVAGTHNYVQARMEDHYNFDDDELYLKEIQTDTLSDNMAQLLISKGYKAYSQSDKNQIATGFFDGQYGKTPLPHKTIATLAGIGWIGKNNLLITPTYGCGLCLGAILTDAPLPVSPSQKIKSKCGKCKICLDICQTHALKGCTWNKSKVRENMMDVHKCTTCMKCLVHCPFTQKYMEKSPHNHTKKIVYMNK